ncbi:MAG TPA: glycosyltransferase, partial [Paludibacteraceae bacterium]|nr:glycosyltransferase [Paludibacteraceae bacterium]
MKNAHIITPVKDSWGTTRQTIEAIAQSETTFNYVYTVYNDFSTDENRVHLELITQQYGFELLNLEDITSHLSPNYLLILQMAQQRALAEQAHLIIVESDVVVRKQTIQDLIDAANADEKIGMVASVTVDENAQVNFPYLYARKFPKTAIDTKKRFSFCCTLLSYNFLQAYDFK